MDGGEKVSVGQVAAIVALIAGIYRVDPALLDCIVYRESSYNVQAVNAVHEGLCQYKPSTRTWMLGLAAADPGWLHGGIPAGPVQDVALTAWALRRGYGSHWAVYRACIGDTNEND